MQDKEKRILEILQKELELYNSLEVLVKEQERKIEESDIEGLLKIISKKQTLISEQERLDEELEKMQVSLSNPIEANRNKLSILNLVSEGVKEDVEKLMNLIKEKILKILEAENKSREKLSLEIEKVREALKNIKNGKKLINKYYGNTGLQEPKFIDQRK